MRCRRIKTWIDEDEKQHRDVVWFGSYGRNVLANKQEIVLTSDQTLVEGTVANQTYYLSFKNLNITNILFYDSDNDVISRYTTNEIGNHSLKGILKAPVSKIEITYSDYDSSVPVKLVFDEYAVAKFYNKDNKSLDDNFSSEQEGIKDSLTQKISVLKKELWYNIGYGMPVANRERSKLAVDSFIATVVESHPDVIRIENFSSKIVNKQYSCYMTIVSKYGNLKLEV